MEDLREWDKYLSSEVPVILQAGAATCKPSQKLKRHLRNNTQDFMGHAKYVFMDVDRFPEIAEKLEIKDTP